jgi:predicted nuclease with RNAse H fold
VITVGIDLAAEPARTAAVRIEWVADRAVVTDLAVQASDDVLVRLCEGADKVGIDCPLGWPDRFIDFLVRNRDGGVVDAVDTVAARRPLVYRLTDLRCQEFGLRPLSVAADRIGHAALRCAGLLGKLGEVDRSGDGRVVEAYPAGSLKIWGLPHQRYKDDAGILERSLQTLEGQVGLTFAEPGAWITCTRSDHAFDAVVVALTARAAALGRTERPPDDALALTRREGWISLPDPALEALRATGTPHDHLGG